MRSQPRATPVAQTSVQDIKRNMKNMRIDIVPRPRYETLDKKGGVFAQSLGIFRVLSKILILYLPF